MPASKEQEALAAERRAKAQREAERLQAAADRKKGEDARAAARTEREAGE